MSDQSLRAIASTKRDGCWSVAIYSVVSPDGRQDHNQMEVNIPCRSFEHAAAVAKAYNEGWRP